MFSSSINSTIDMHFIGYLWQFSPQKSEILFKSDCRLVKGIPFSEIYFVLKIFKKKHIPGWNIDILGT